MRTHTQITPENRLERDPTKAEFKVLERIYGAEIESALRHDHLPVQLRSKHLPALEQMGMIEPMESKLGGQFPMTIRGWKLTAFGHMYYCMNCGGVINVAALQARKS